MTLLPVVLKKSVLTFVRRSAEVLFCPDESDFLADLLPELDLDGVEMGVCLYQKAGAM